MDLSIICTSCGAKNLLPDDAESVLCTYCNNPISRPQPVRDTANVEDLLKIIEAGMAKTTTPPKEINPAITEFMKQAAEALALSRYDVAAEYYNNVLELDRYWAEAYFGRAYCYLWSAPPEEVDPAIAIKDFDNAIKCYEDRLTPKAMVDKIVKEVNNWASTNFEVSYQLTIDDANPDRAFPLHVDRCEKYWSILNWAHSIDPKTYTTVYTAIKICDNLSSTQSYTNSNKKKGKLRPDANTYMTFDQRRSLLINSIPFDDPNRALLNKPKSTTNWKWLKYGIYGIIAVIAFKACRSVYIASQEKTKRNIELFEQRQRGAEHIYTVKTDTVKQVKDTIATPKHTDAPKPKKRKKKHS